MATFLRALGVLVLVLGLATAAVAGSGERAIAACGFIWVVTTAPSSIAAMATEKNEAIVRVRVFIELGPPACPRSVWSGGRK